MRSTYRSLGSPQNESASVPESECSPGEESIALPSLCHLQREEQVTSAAVTSADPAGSHPYCYTPGCGEHHPTHTDADFPHLGGDTHPSLPPTSFNFKSTRSRTHH